MKKIWLWYLYDFANSFATVVLLFYYPLILSEKGASDTWIGVSASISTGLLLLILPYIGFLSDRTGRRIYFIRIGAIAMIFSLVLISFIVRNNEFFNIAILLLLTFLYILFQVFSQGSVSLYSAMIRKISNSNNNIKISGQGYGFGQMGNALAIVIISLIIGTSVTIFGLNGKTLAIFLGAIFFFILSFIFLIQKENIEIKPLIKFSYKDFFKAIVNNNKIIYFLIGYSLLADAVLTLQLYIALYVSKVFSFSDVGVSYIAITGLFFSTIGAFITNKFVKKIKNKNLSLRVAGISYAVCFGLCAFMPVIPIAVYIGIGLSGLFFGILFSLFRVIYSEISPENSQGEFFGIFTVFERAASVIGPLIWILTFYLLRNLGESIAYRGSVLLLMVICFVGVYFLKKGEK